MKDAVTTLTRWIAGLCLAFAGVTVPALAQQPFGEAFQVDSGSAMEGSRADVAIDGAGNFIVVWAGNEGGLNGIFGRMYDAAGQPLGTPFQVSDGADRDPKVAIAESGGFLVVWAASTPAGVPRPISGRHYDASATAGPEFQINLPAGQGFQPSLAADPDGGFVVVWQDGGIRVAARRIDALGAPSGGEFTVNASTTTGNDDPSVGVDAAGNFVVAWHRGFGPVSFRRFDATGTPLTGDVAVPGLSVGTEVAVAPNGDFMVARGIDGDVFADPFDATGTRLGPTFVVARDFDYYYTYAISIAPDPAGSGNFVVAWQAADLDDEWSENFRIEGAMVDRRGRPLAASGFRASPVRGWPPYTEPSVALSASGHLVTAWTDSVTDHVYARRYGASRMSGTVTDVNTGLPLAGATVAIPGQPNFTTDADGRYGRVLPPGSYDVTVSMQHYVAATAGVDVQFGAPAVLDFALAGLPVLQTAGYTFDDSGPGGNANGVVDANERFLLRLTVRNTGPGAATGVSATVSSPTAGVTVLQPTSTYPDIAPGAQSMNEAAFELVTPTTHPLGAPLLADLAVATDQGPATLHYSIPTGQTRNVVVPVAGPFEIPDRGIRAAVPFPVSGIEGVITQVGLRLHVTHPVVSDLHIQLFSPDGMRVQLAYAIPAAGPNLGTDCPAGLNDTIFTDGAPIHIDEGTSPYIGGHRPDEPLARFSGKSGAAVNGTWWLEVDDFWAVPGQASAGRVECAKLVLDAYRPATGGHQEVAISGTVTDAFTGAPVGGAAVSTVSGFSTVTGPDGRYVLDVLPGTYDMVAEAPGYQTAGATGVTISSGTASNVDFALAPVVVAVAATAVDDQGVGGNGNGRVDLNERFQLRVTLANAGAADLTAVSAALSSTMAGVVVTQGHSAYPDIPTGGTAANMTEFALQTAPDFAAGRTLDLLLAVATAQGAVTVPLGLETGTALDTPIVLSASGPVPILRSGSNPPSALAFTVSGMASPVAKVLAQVHVKNPEARRVALWLEGPDATKVFLSTTRPGFPGIGADFGTDCPADANDTTFDDAATLFIGAAPVGRVGSFRPDQPIAAFRSKEANGVWTLGAHHTSPQYPTAYGTLECARLLVYGSVSADAVPLSDRIFFDGFETGDLSAWSGVSNESGDLQATAAAALAGTSRGLQAAVNDTEPLYVRDETPAGEPRYRARFHFDPNGFDPGEAAGRLRAIVFMALDESPQKRVVQLILRRQGGVYSLRARITLDDGTRAETPFVTISDAPHVVEFDWVQATAAGAGDGSFQLWIDGAAAPALTGLHNHAYAVDYVRLGAMVLKAGASGTMYFDRFESRRETYIGP